MFNFINTYQNLPNLFYSFVESYAFPKPQLLLLNEALASSMGLDHKELKENGHLYLSSQQLENKLIAQAYSGHQFGHFTHLGDGRAVLLGEIPSPIGLLDLQLKGSGPTPYSRRGDGKATLYSMLREYLISEAMHALNIPTTRSLAVVTTGEDIYREIPHKGAILSRISKSHIRVGTFQYAASQQSVKALADYTIDRLYPGTDYIGLLDHVIKKQADLIAQWQSIGFIHGVMNTDNMSIAGETIDYGPCAFMDQYDPKTVFSSIDHQGRYAYLNQPNIGLWNLSRFAETLLPLLADQEDESIAIAEKSLKKYYDYYQASYLKYFSRKIGLKNPVLEDLHLIDQLLKIMNEESLDFTNTFLTLPITDAPYMKEWKDLWFKRLSLDQETLDQAIIIMEKSNPQVIPRNHIVEEVLKEAMEGHIDAFKEFLNILSKPFEAPLKKYTLPTSSKKGSYRTYCGT